MMSIRLTQFLDDHGVRYVSLRHSPVFSAQDLAHAVHLHGWELAKTVIVEADGNPVMAVVEAPRWVDLDLLLEATGADRILVPGEAELAKLFPDCEVGAMPPFGNLWGMPVFVDEALARHRHIAFAAGSHADTIRMGTSDFLRLARANITAISREAPAPSPESRAEWAP